MPTPHRRLRRRDEPMRERHLRPRRYDESVLYAADGPRPRNAVHAASVRSKSKDVNSKCVRPMSRRRCKIHRPHRRRRQRDHNCGSNDVTYVTAFISMGDDGHLHIRCTDQMWSSVILCTALPLTDLLKSNNVESTHDLDIRLTTVHPVRPTPDCDVTLAVRANVKRI